MSILGDILAVVTIFVMVIIAIAAEVIAERNYKRDSKDDRDS